MWQARLQTGSGDMHRLQILDQGTFFSPLILEVCSGGLSRSIAAWQNQHTLHALQVASHLISMQLQRYTQRDSSYRKVQTPCNILAGELVSMPTFFSDGLQLTCQRYQLYAVVYHIGNSPYSGHYKAALSVASDGKGNQKRWYFYIVDDGLPRNPLQVVIWRTYLAMPTSASFANVACMTKSLARACECCDFFIYTSHLPSEVEADFFV